MSHFLQSLRSAKSAPVYAMQVKQTLGSLRYDNYYMQLLKEEIEKEMQKNNVFILGAGFSVGAGIPTMDSYESTTRNS